MRIHPFAKRPAVVVSALVLILALAALASTAMVRAIAWPSKQLAVEPIERFAVDGEAAARRLSGAIRYATISDVDPAKVDPAAFDALHRHLEASFPAVRAQLLRETVNGASLLYTWRGTDASARPIVLQAHQDVVPVEPGTEARWEHGAFSGDVTGGFIWGRGTLDDKGDMLAILEAVEALASAGYRPSRTVYLAFGHDEEVGGEQGAARIVALLRSRGVRPEFVLDEGGAITRGIVPNLDGPVALVGVAEKGYLSVELSAGSGGGHSSMPPATTAVGRVAAAVADLEANPLPGTLDGVAGLMFDHLAPEWPLLPRLAMANRWLLGGLVDRQIGASPGGGALLRTTTAATVIEGGVKDNVLPSRARAVVNFRIKPGETVEGVLDHVRRTTRDRGVAVRVDPGGHAAEPSPVSRVDSEGYRTIARTIRQVMPGTVVAPTLVLGGTDSAHFVPISDDVYRFCPYALGPDDTARLHGLDERISIAAYADCVRFHVQLLRNAAPPAADPARPRSRGAIPEVAR